VLVLIQQHLPFVDVMRSRRICKQFKEAFGMLGGDNRVVETYVDRSKAHTCGCCGNVTRYGFLIWNHEYYTYEVASSGMIEINPCQSWACQHDKPNRQFLH
jgi:hypothetical protein